MKLYDAVFDESCPVVYDYGMIALILIAALILLDMRNLRGGNDVKVIIPPTAAATS